MFSEPRAVYRFLCPTVFDHIVSSYGCVARLFTILQTTVSFKLGVMARYLVESGLSPSIASDTLLSHLVALGEYSSHQYVNTVA